MGLQCGVGSRRCGRQDLVVVVEIVEKEMGGCQPDGPANKEKLGPGLKKKIEGKYCFVNHNKKKNFFWTQRRLTTRGCWCSKYNTVAQNRYEYQYKRPHKVVWQRFKWCEDRKKKKNCHQGKERSSLGEKKKNSTLFFYKCTQQAKAKNKTLLHMHVSGRNKLSLTEWTLGVQNQREIKVSCTVVTPCWGDSFCAP